MPDCNKLPYLLHSQGDKKTFVITISTAGGLWTDATFERASLRTELTTASTAACFADIFDACFADKFDACSVDIFEVCFDDKFDVAPCLSLSVNTSCSAP